MDLCPTVIPAEISMAYYMDEAWCLNAFFCNMMKFLLIYHRGNVGKEYEIREKGKIIYILHVKCTVVCMNHGAIAMMELEFLEKFIPFFCDI